MEPTPSDEFLEIEEGQEIPEGYEEYTPPQEEAKEEPEKQEPKEEPKSLRDELGIEDEVKDDDPDLEESDLEDDKEDKTVDEKSLLDEFDKDEVNLDDLGLPKNFAEMQAHEQDKELLLALEDDKTWAGWRKSAEEIGGDADKEFAVQAVRAGYDPEYLSARGIYSLKDFGKRLEQEEAKTSDTAIVLGNPENDEERANFYEEYLGIPKSIEGYDVSGLKGTVFDGDKEATDALLQKAARMSLSKAQFLAEAHEKDAMVKESQKRERIALNKYRQSQKEKLGQLYGESSKAIISDAISALKSTASGQLFLKEFGEDKVSDSAAFYGLIHELLNYNVSKRDITLLGNTEGSAATQEFKHLKAHKTEYLLAEAKRIGKLNVMSKDNVNHPDPAVRAKHMKAVRALTALEMEIERRKHNR